jgi:hypothetical protein
MRKVTLKQWLMLNQVIARLSVQNDRVSREQARIEAQEKEVSPQLCS